MIPPELDAGGLRPTAGDDDWYDSEESTRRGMIDEIQRILRRTRARIVPVLVLAATITGLLAWKLVTRKTLVEAEVVLALTEGSLSAKHNGLPVDDLRDYVGTVLLSDAKLAELIERRGIRKPFGMQLAIENLRDQLDIQIWKNSFVYYDEDAQNAEHSARIGLTVADSNPDRAFELARDLAAIAIRSITEERTAVTKRLAGEIERMRADHERRLDALVVARLTKQVAMARARADHKEGVAEGLTMELVEIDHEAKSDEKSLSDIAQSHDALADRISAAGLDIQLQIVEENRPEPSEHRTFLLVMIVVVVGLGSLLGSALVVGAFDSRVHDPDDVERLGLAVLGHVPGFPGDHVGSLHARGAARARVPSFLRWRSHR